MRSKEKLVLMGVIVSLLLFSLPTFGQAEPVKSDEDLLKLIDSLETTKRESPPPQNAPGDVLKDVDTTGPISEKVKPPEMPTPTAETIGEGFAAQLVKNFHGSVRLRGMQYTQNPPDRPNVDERNTFGNVLAKFTNKTGGKSWDLNVGGWLEYGNEENTYSGTFTNEFAQDTDRRRRILEINELFLNFSGTNYNAVLGRKTITNGISTLFMPADRMRPQDLNDPMDPKDLNLWQARFDYYLGNHNLTALFLPVYQENKVPSETSRWMGEKKSGDTVEADIYDAGNAGMENDRAKITDNNFGYLLRWKGTVNGWDLFASYYHGPNPYYVVREERVATGVPGQTKPIRYKEVIKTDTIATGFSTSYEKWEFHGEATYTNAYDRKDDNYINYVAGFTYTIDDWAKKIFLEKIDITLEYANEIITNFQNAETYVASSKKSRLGKNDILSRVNLEYNDKLSFQFLCNFSLTRGEEGRYQKLMAKYKIRDGLISKLSLEFFGGQNDSLYGRWSRNDRVTLEIEYSF